MEHRFIVITMPNRRFGCLPKNLRLRQIGALIPCSRPHWAVHQVSRPASDFNDIMRAPLLNLAIYINVANNDNSQSTEIPSNVVLEV